MKPTGRLKRLVLKLNTTTSVGALLFWSAQLVLLVAALLVVDQSIRLFVFLTYLAVMVFVLVTKLNREKAILDPSAHRKMAPIIRYLNSVIQPRIPIRYRTAHRDYLVSPKTLAELFNLLIETKPKNVLELGSGMTTLIASYALKKNGFGKIVSWDWIETRASGNRDLMNSHGQRKYGEILDVKISQSKKIDGTNSWFDRQPEDKIDFLVVDDSLEPPVTPGGKDIMEALRPYLNIGSTILLHDRKRTGDSETLRHWLESETELLLVHRAQTKTNTHWVLRFAPPG